MIALPGRLSEDAHDRHRVNTGLVVLPPLRSVQPSRLVPVRQVRFLPGVLVKGMAGGAAH